MTAQRNEAYSLLRAEYLCEDASQAHNCRSDRRSLAIDMLGENYDTSGYKSTYRRHKALAIAQIKRIAGADNFSRQQQLAEAVAEHYKSGGGDSIQSGGEDYVAHSAVIEGIVQTLEMLRKRNRGRYPTEDRITQEVLLGSVVAAAKGKFLSSISQLLKCRKRTLEKAATRMGVSLNDDRPSLFALNETSCNAYDPSHGAFIRECWDELTRPSECTSDEAKDPEADDNGIHHTHRIHWINTRLDDLLAIMEALGTEQFGVNFSISKPTMLKYKQHYHRYPGRNTCLCRYHMEFDHHFYALRRWKAAARRALPSLQHATLVEMPGSPKEFRQFLMCEREGEYYGWDCAKRSCVDCKGKLASLFTDAEKLAVPVIKHQAWTEVPYTCKDGRQIKNHDFRPAEAAINDYIGGLDEWLTDTFLSHHNRAKFLDNDWKLLWDDVSKVDARMAAKEQEEPAEHGEPVHWWDLPEEQWLDLDINQEIAMVIDYANSYETEHKDEHMQQFWSHQSTTILGCAMKIPVQMLNDKFFEERAVYEKTGRLAMQERMECLRVLAANKMPPEVVVMHFGITSNPHHDTAWIQHFFQHNLYPDFFQKYTVSKGARLTVRSDGCAGQMKSGRHFRWIANYHTYDWNLDHILLWTHSESAHGKDRCDSECGRLKYILRCHEMRDTPELPTILQSALAQYEHLDNNHRATRRTLRQKKGKGTYYRFFHWMPAKSIRPLSSLAEVNTLSGTVTMKSHFFRNCKHTKKISVREIACLSCSQCTLHKYRRCENAGFCGHMVERDVNLKSNAREHAAETRLSQRVQAEGRERAQRVKAGMFIGSECTNETEPYIVSIALTDPMIWAGEDDTCWMGKITAGAVLLSFTLALLGACLV